ncbi:MAG: DUF503 domain-containing protein [Clostridiales bacterium]|jgi:uncharacterized protein YlxP (DUF503 family)|nr:DUF503 domain-containing protein [Clostridiales bacterium]OPZ68199.1 MAG: hypothetical protein BWY81_00946 [Firmicutes bacterium ADurb.Bin467]
MTVLLLTLTLRAPWCLSLKDKRSEVKRLIARLRSQFNASACETGRQDMLTLIELGVAALAFDHAQADSIVERVAAFVEANTDAELLSVSAEYR